MNRSFDFSLPGHRHSQVSGAHNSLRRTIGRRAVDRALIGKHPIIFCTFRIVLYITITAVSVEAILYAAQHMDAEFLFSENGVMEWAQFSGLVLCAVLLKVASHQMQELGHGFHMLAVFPLIASIRELDHILDTYLFDGAWQLLVSMLLFYLFFFARKNYETLKQQLRHIFSFPSTGLLISGFVTIVIFSRLFGKQVFWQAVLQENYLRLVARTVEEGCEFFGYLLLLFGCIEYVFIAISSRSSGRSESRQNI